MSRAPWFPFYAKDWFDAKVLRMDLDAQGAYIRILAHMWADTDDCALSADLESLRKILGISKTKMNKIWNQMMPKDDPIFTLKDGMIISERLKIEKEKQEDRSKKAQESIGARWNKTKNVRNTNVKRSKYYSQSQVQPEENTPPDISPQRGDIIPPSLPDGLPKEPPVGKGNQLQYPDLFEEVWKMHAKGTKKPAYKAWWKIITDLTNGDGPRPPNEQLKAALSAYLADCRERKSSFIQDLSTFLGEQKSTWRQYWGKQDERKNPYSDWG